MTLIRYTASNAPRAGSVVGYSGTTFNVAAALATGSGSFTVDDVSQAALVAALDAFPGVQRAGGAGNTGGGVGSPTATQAYVDARQTGQRIGMAAITSSSTYTAPAGVAPGDGSNPLILSGQPIDGIRPIALNLHAPFVSLNNAGATHHGVILGCYKLSSSGTWLTQGTFLSFTSNVAAQRFPVQAQLPFGVLPAGTYDFKVQLQPVVVGDIMSLICDDGSFFLGPATLMPVYQ